MRFVADENVDAGIVRALRQAGYDVLFVAEMAPSIPDSEVLALANENDALLITADKDFAELVFRQRLVHAGILLIRLYGLDETTKAALIVLQIQRHGQELTGAFSVLTPDALRIRPKLVY